MLTDVGNGSNIDVIETTDAELLEVSGTEGIACRASISTRTRRTMYAWMQENIVQRWYSAIKETLYILKNIGEYCWWITCVSRY